MAESASTGPLAWTVPQSARSVDQSRGSAAGAQACQAGSTSLAASSGHCRKAVETRGAAKVSTVNEVTTPRCPPPPPRSAQNRSGSASALTVTASPAAVTTRIDVTASHVRP